MTDISPEKMAGEISAPGSTRVTPARSRHTAKRFASESRFKYAGLACVIIAAGFLVLLLSTVVGNGIPAFTSNNLVVPVNLSSEQVNSEAPEDADYRSLLNTGLKELMPYVSGRTNTRNARRLLSTGAPIILREEVLEDEGLLGATRQIALPLSDTADLYLKGLYGTLETTRPEAVIEIAREGNDVTITASEPVFATTVEQARAAVGELAARDRRRAIALGRSVALLETRLADAERLLSQEGVEAARRERAEANVEKWRGDLASIKDQIATLETRATALEARAGADSGTEKLTRDYPSLFIRAGGGVVKITETGASSASGEIMMPLSNAGRFAANEWSFQTIELPESERKIPDQEIVWLEALQEAGHIETGLNEIFFTRGASREAEMAGIWGAVVGSFLTLVVTLLLSFPIGVAAATYLEEFAPKNKITDLIEVNINNLAAVPSIVFGLLGLAVFLNFMHLPRSAPLVGGIVLALMTLPTIIIASRAALKAVPPSIREAALGVGASKIQTVFHHVLPLAMPGMLTGTIIGMAQALGETAPLLMIGMVAFIVDIPGGFTDPATVLPVQIFMWADFPEIAFQQKTAAAIMVLLAFLILMNAIAVLLRKRFERRW